MRILFWRQRGSVQRTRAALRRARRQSSQPWFHITRTTCWPSYLSEWSTKSSWKCVCNHMDLFGWRYDKAKSPPPAPAFRLLGVTFTLNVQRPFVSLPGAHLERLIAEMKWQLDNGSLLLGEASSLHGSFGWARSSLSVRFRAAALRATRIRQCLAKLIRVVASFKSFTDVCQGLLPTVMSVAKSSSLLPMAVVEGILHLACGRWTPERASHHSHKSAL